MPGQSPIAEFIDQLPLVDHHVHGAFRVDGDEERFLNNLNEGNNTPLTDPRSSYDTQLGFAIRRWCATILDLPTHPTPQQYWQRRCELGEQEVGRRLTRAAGVSHWLIDTGFKSEELHGPAGMVDLTGSTAREILRLETLGSTLIADIGDPAGYPEAFRAALDSRDSQVVGTKSVLAYRTGFDVDLSRPTDADVVRAARRWHGRVSDDPTDQAPRMIDPVLLSFGIHSAVDARLPIQFHVGLGDRDLDLAKANPLHLTTFLRNHDRTGVPILLLHCYPFEREAGYLAQAFDTVHLDVGLAINFVGARATDLVARSLELAPFRKILYSSDAFGPAELHYLGAKLWRVGMARTLSGFIDDGDWSQGDAERVATLIARDNADRVYQLNQDRPSG